MQSTVPPPPIKKRQEGSTIGESKPYWLVYCSVICSILSAAMMGYSILCTKSMLRGAGMKKTYSELDAKKDCIREVLSVNLTPAHFHTTSLTHKRSLIHAWDRSQLNTTSPSKIQQYLLQPTSTTTKTDWNNERYIGEPNMKIYWKPSEDTIMMPCTNSWTLESTQTAISTKSLTTAF